MSTTYTITLHLLGTCDATSTWIPVKLDDVVLLPKAIRDGAFIMDFWNSTDFLNAASDPTNEKVLVTNVLIPLNGLIVLRAQGGTTATAKTPGKDYVLTVDTPASVSSPTGTEVPNETPAGVVNGSNATFTLVSAPIAGSLKLYKNGVRQTNPTDFTISGLTITFAGGNVPQTGDILLADYRV